jgi:spore photoproduct lyase
MAMAKLKDYEKKFRSLKSQTSFSDLDPGHQAFIHDLARDYRLTFQELKLVCEAALDLRMWNEKSLMEWWKEERGDFHRADKSSKKQMLQRLETWLASLRRAAKSYPKEGLPKPPPYSLELVAERSDKTILGMCPVASEETVCCNLRTFDAVENCGFGCSYCAVQTFYGDRVVFDADLGEKLKNLDLDPGRFYHLGTGQASDSLMWGNQYGMLDRLCELAHDRPNILLELKTKSKNVRYFLDHDAPHNIVLSWSLNTPTIIRNEEHFTAQLDERLGAARRVADRGIKVAFHFHPLVYYQDWFGEYRSIVEQVMARFTEKEVLFISFGAVTFIKPVIKAIRKRGWASKMLQMELVPAPKGKLSSSDRMKTEMFQTMYRAFAPWHGEVFMYLCMEKRDVWESTFGHAYGSNEDFEADFGRKVFAKLSG